MAKLSRISGKELCKILEKIGFKKIYGKGSHVGFKHVDGRRTVVPIHANEDLESRTSNSNIKTDKIDKRRI